MVVIGVINSKVNRMGLDNRKNQNPGYMIKGQRPCKKQALQRAGGVSRHLGQQSALHLRCQNSEPCQRGRY